MNSITLSLVVVSTVLALSACSEELSTQAKKAAAEISVEANKAASQKIEQMKTDAVGQLKSLKVETETRKEEKPGEADGKISGEKSK